MIAQKTGLVMAVLLAYNPMSKDKIGDLLGAKADRYKANDLDKAYKNK